MMVWFYLSVCEFTGCSHLELTGQPETLQEMIDELGKRFGEEFYQYLLAEDTCFYLVNGKATLHTGGLLTRLQPGDKVEILPVVEAG